MLEYASVAWNPWKKHDKELLDKVQKRCLSLATSSVTIDSLGHRRYMTDMKETYKIIHSKYKIKRESFFCQPLRPLRGHSQKLAKERVMTDVRKYYFSNRIVDQWNSLDNDIVNAPSGTCFKERLRAVP